MRFIFILLCLFSGANSLACSQPEAQIIAKIYETVISPYSCTAIVQFSDIRFFAPSIICPLDHSEVTSFGVNVGFDENFDCRLKVGDELNGVIYRSSNGDILFE